MKVGVFFYSWTGHTKEVAGIIADHYIAELNEIKEKVDRKGRLDFFRGIFQAFFGSNVDIIMPSNKPEDYDMVFLGTPVWAGRQVPAIKTFVEKTNWADKPTFIFLCQSANSQKYMNTVSLFMEGHQANVIGSLYINDKCSKEEIKERVLEKISKLKINKKEEE